MTPRPKRDEVERLLQDHPDWTTQTVAKLADTNRAYVGAIRAEMLLRERGEAIRKTILPADIERVVNETERYLDTLQARVNEGKGIDAASAFGRWIAFSGIIDLCTKAGGHSAILRQKIVKLVNDCGERYASNDTGPKLETLELKTISEKLDRLEKLMNKAA